MVRIADILLNFFLNDPLINCYCAVLLYTASASIVEEDVGGPFIKKAIKECLHKYSKYEGGTTEKSKSRPKPLYFNRKGATKKVNL